jgi:cytochrome c oxidase subunit IV
MAESNSSHNNQYSGTEIPADGHQAHPLKVYFVVWGWLFVLSACSYAIDFMGVQGYLRWTLILFFMFVKAGLIVAIFMHMGKTFLDLCCPSAADSSFGFCGDYGDRIQLYCLNTVYFF